jgi:hypothetical protein
MFEQVMYNVPMFFQTVLFESAQDAGLHLVVPSLSFTVVSAITASLIARWKSPAPTLSASQACLALGTIGLLVMATVFPLLPMSRWSYNFMLILPAVGASMMAPSALLTLLNFADSETHAVYNGAFIMARSLGVFIATSLSATTIQNVFLLSFDLRNYDDAHKQAIQDVRQNINLIYRLEDDLKIKGKHISSSTTALTEMYSLCRISESLRSTFCLLRRSRLVDCILSGERKKSTQSSGCRGGTSWGCRRRPREWL